MSTRRKWRREEAWHRGHPALFWSGEAARSLDPRAYGPVADAAQARWDDAAEAVGAFWSQWLAVWQNAGIAGFRLDLQGIPAAVLQGFVRGCGQRSRQLCWAGRRA